MYLEIKEIDFSKFKADFLREYNRIEPYKSRRVLTNDEVLLSEYRTEIVKTYNNLANYLANIYENGTHKTKTECVSKIQPFITKIKSCFDILQLEYDWPTYVLATVDPNKIRNIDNGTQSKSQDSSSAPVDDTGNDSDSSQISHNSNRSKHSQHSVQLLSAKSNSDSGSESDTMPQTKQELAKFAASVINYKFDGNPLKLDGFLADIDIIIDITEENNMAFCLKFIKGRLEGRALEAMPEKIEKIDDVTNALKAKITYDNSTVIEGRLAALRLQNGNFTKFTAEAEKLADALRRSLIKEGISQAKADQMTIAKTIEICRKTARNETVKSVLSSTKYESPSEVLSKLVTETDVARREYKESQQSKSKKSNGNNSNRNKNFHSRGGNNGNSFSNRNRNGNDYKSDNKNFQGNRNGNSSNYRGNGRGNFNNRQSNQSIRLISGASQSNQIDATEQNQTEQVFRLALN